MGLFKGIENAQTSEGGNYLNPGVYDVVLQRINTGRTRKGVDFVAVDFQIVQTSNSEKHPVGSTANYFCGADKDGFLSNVKIFAAAVLANALPIGQSFDMAQITEEVMEGLTANNGQAVVGQKLRVQVTHVQTKAGGTYSRHQWSPGAKAAA
jgi:hypothetical protein